MSILSATNDRAKDSRVKRTRWAPFALVVLIVLAGGFVALRGLGRWLVREDPLVSADVIVVLSGSMPARAEEAAMIYQDHFAPEVWLTHPKGPAEELSRLGIRYLSEDNYNQEVLLSEGVPSQRVRVLADPILDTEEEIREVVREMRAQNKTSAIVVTSAPHTRRVRTLWQRLSGRGLTLTVRAARQDPFDADHWWRDTTSALSVVREVLGLMNAWAGLPIRPRAG